MHGRKVDVLVGKLEHYLLEIIEFDCNFPRFVALVVPLNKFAC